MTDYAPDNAIYLIAIRSTGPKNGREVSEALGAIREHVEPVTSPQVVALRADESGAQHNEALRTLGFDFNAANSIFVVASEGGEGG